MRNDSEIVESAINHIDKIQDSVSIINEIQRSPIVIKSFNTKPEPENVLFEVGNTEMTINDVSQEYDYIIDEFAYGSNDIVEINKAATNSLMLAALFDLKSRKLNRGEYVTENPEFVDAITCLMLESTSSSTQSELNDIYEKLYCLIRDMLTTQYEGMISKNVTERFECRDVHKASSQFDIHIYNGVRQIEFV